MESRDFDELEIHQKVVEARLDSKLTKTIGNLKIEGDCRAANISSFPTYQVEPAGRPAECKHLADHCCIIWPGRSRRRLNTSTETVFKEKHGVLDPVTELTITSPYVDSRVDSNTCTMGNPMPESTLSPGQGLRI
jgi:hypothetical protein